MNPLSSMMFRRLCLVTGFALGCTTSPPEAASPPTSAAVAPGPPGKDQDGGTSAHSDPGETSAPANSDAMADGEGLPFPLRNGAVLPDGLFVGGQPTLAQLVQAKNAGITTIITLRTNGETGTEGEAELASQLGLKLIAIPIAGPDDLTVDNARRLAAVFATERPGQVLLHCRSSNRVGALLALKAHFVDGLDPSAALALGKAAGLGSLEKVTRERLGL